MKGCSEEAGRGQAADGCGAPAGGGDTPGGAGLKLASCSLLQFTPQLKGLLVDAAGTLLLPSEPVAEVGEGEDVGVRVATAQSHSHTATCHMRTVQVYLHHARKYGCTLSAEQVLDNFREAYNSPWGQSTIRYVGSGRQFWREIVRRSTGCSSEALFETLYDHYSRYLRPAGVPCGRKLPICPTHPWYPTPVSYCSTCTAGVTPTLSPRARLRPSIASGRGA